MTNRLRFAFWCYVFLLVSLAAWGIGFLLRSEFTSYHSVAVGLPWSEVPRNFQILILALIKLAGGLWVAFTLCVSVILLVPFRQGARWALWAVPLLLIAQYCAPMPAMALVTLNTPATPPWVLAL
jgi:hypothetical protein